MTPLGHSSIRLVLRRPRADRRDMAVSRAVSTPGTAEKAGTFRRRTALPAPLLAPVQDLQARDVHAWRDLAARAAEPNPFFEPECVLPAARHLGGPAPALLIVKDRGGEWLACLPVIPALRRRRVPLPVMSS